MKNTYILGTIIFLLIATIIALGTTILSSKNNGEVPTDTLHIGAEGNSVDNTQILDSEMMMPTDADGEAAMREHCKMMPEMQGCEKYISN